MATAELTICEPGRKNAEKFMTRHFADLVGDLDGADSPLSSAVFRGGQRHAEKALADLDLSGYTRDRNHAYPRPQRAATGLSPYVRHGMLSLPRLWDEVTGPTDELNRFRVELLWQEYARHWYARLGVHTRQPLRFQRQERRGSLQPIPTSVSIGHGHHDPSPGWNESMGCMEITSGELFDDGWLVGQTRLWMASQWAVREGRDWRAGESLFFTHLLDGSRAANRLGWQMAAGLMSERPYAFSRWQVETRAPGLCASCDLNTDCPIDRWPDRPPTQPVDTPNPLLFSDPDPDRTAGPPEARSKTPSAPSASNGAPDVVWITAESMGNDDPALLAHPELPAVFVFDRPLLAKLQLSAKRLTFMVETLAELATTRPLEVHLGTPAEALDGRRVATTFAPVPGWRRHAAAVEPDVVHPWPWLRRPSDGDISSFAGWYRELWGHALDDRPSEPAARDIPMLQKMG
ncbi:MAG: deoxyribodipyrimidine photolyase [Acidimicrobiia bacterium]|nr:deoxyribodipyrimidine photolyase [Acidimicrobiia bacterium]